MLNQTIDAYKKVKHDLFIAKTISKIVVSLLTATYFTCAIIFKFGNYLKYNYIFERSKY